MDPTIADPHRRQTLKISLKLGFLDRVAAGPEGPPTDDISLVLVEVSEKTARRFGPAGEQHRLENKDSGFPNMLYQIYLAENIQRPQAADFA